jgi:hypothetical protein
LQLDPSLVAARTMLERLHPPAPQGTAGHPPMPQEVRGAQLPLRPLRSLPPT